MLEFALILPNILEYACIYLNKQTSEYARVLNVSEPVHSIRSLTNHWAVIETVVFRTLSNIKIEALQKE